MNMEVLGQLAAENSIVDNKFEKSAGPLGMGLRMLGRGLRRSPLGTAAVAGVGAGALNDAASYIPNPLSRSRSNWSPFGTEWNPAWHLDRISSDNPSVANKMFNVFAHPLQTASAFFNPQEGENWRTTNNQLASKTVDPRTGRSRTVYEGGSEFRPRFQYWESQLRNMGATPDEIANYRARWLGQSAGPVSSPNQGGMMGSPGGRQPIKPGVPSDPFHFAPVFSYHND